MVDNIAYKGSYITIKWAKKINGRMPAKSFFDKILTDYEKIKLNALFEFMGERGSIVNIDQFRKIQGYDLYEWKGRKSRILCYYENDCTIINTNGFIKKSRKTPTKQIIRAENIRKECEGILWLKI